MSELFPGTIKALDALMKIHGAERLALNGKVYRVILELVEYESKSYAGLTNAGRMGLVDQLIREAMAAIEEQPLVSDREIVDELKHTSKLGCGEPLYFAGPDDDSGLRLVALLRVKKMLVEVVV